MKLYIKYTKMKKLFNQLLLATLFFIVACNSESADGTASPADKANDSASFDLSNARSSIQAANAKFGEAIQKGDSVLLASGYTQDAWVLPPNSETVKGNDIAAFWGSFIRMGVKDIKLTVDDLTGNADQLAETGTYEIYGAENKLFDKGKYIVVWKPEGGTWKMHRDIFNTSMPPSPAK
jgi:ketosteroid isomerase-like protein